jgi:hypothetical protein
MMCSCIFSNIFFSLLFFVLCFYPCYLGKWQSLSATYTISGIMFSSDWTLTKGLLPWRVFGLWPLHYFFGDFLETSINKCHLIRVNPVQIVFAFELWLFLDSVCRLANIRSFHYRNFWRFSINASHGSPSAGHSAGKNMKQKQIWS